MQKDKVTYRPLLNRLIVKLDDPEKTSEGGIVIPDSAQGSAPIGVVLAAGPGVMGENGKPVKMMVKKGDRVIVNAARRIMIEHGGEMCMICAEYEVLAVEE